MTGFATFSLIGFYSALIPSLLGETLHQTAPLVAGAIVCELFLIAAIAILASGAFASQAATLAAALADAACIRGRTGWTCRLARLSRQP